MKKVLILIAAATSAAGMLPANASAADILARVISSTPVVQQIAVPRQVCNNQAVVSEAPKSGAGALMGAVAGGAAGNAIGNGNGRALATVIGLMGGAIVGNNIEGSSNQVRNVQQCTTQTVYENRASHYNVVYEYQGTQYNVQMPNDPGQYVRLQVTPVGSMNAPPQAGFPTPPQTYTYPQQPQSFLQQNQPQPGYIQQSSTFVQSAPVFSAPVYASPVYIAPAYVAPAFIAPAYYARPYYPSSYNQRPYYGPSYAAPIGLSLNIGYSKIHGGNHWR